MSNRNAKSRNQSKARARSPRANVNGRRPKQKSRGLILKRRPRSESSLTAREKDKQERALNLLSDLRRGEGSYSKLLRKHHINSRTVRRYLGRDLLGGTRGRPVRASKADRRVRDLMFPKPFGDVPHRTRSSKDATNLSEFFRDRDKLVHNKLRADVFEAKWRRVRIAGQELFADADAILRMANAGDLKVENLYASTAGER
jgi:hypothetical protein